MFLIKTVLVSGTTKHSITLPAQDGHEPLLKDLCEALTEATGVPTPSQKIIFKGTSGCLFHSCVDHSLHSTGKY